MDRSAFGVDQAALAAIASRYGIARLDVFGSVARGEDTIDSDIDVLYVLAPDARLGWLVDDLADELSQLFGRPVDVVSRRRTSHDARRRAVGSPRDLCGVTSCSCARCSRRVLVWST